MLKNSVQWNFRWLEYQNLIVYLLSCFPNNCKLNNLFSQGKFISALSSVMKHCPAEKFRVLWEASKPQIIAISEPRIYTRMNANKKNHHTWEIHVIHHMIYLKQSSSVDKAFTNCFFKPSFMCRDGNMLFLSTSDWCKMFGSQSLRSDLGSKFDWNQYF